MIIKRNKMMVTTNRILTKILIMRITILLLDPIVEIYFLTLPKEMLDIIMKITFS